MSSVSKLCSVTNYPILNVVHKCRFSKSKCIYFEEFVVHSIMCHIMWETGVYEQLKWYAISVISYPWNVQCNGYTVCPTRCWTRHFFNNSNTNEDIATKFEQEYVRCVRNEKECVCSAPNCCETEQWSASQPGSVASGTHCIIFVRCSDSIRFWCFCIYMIIPSIILILSPEHVVISQLN